jgi:hypothetical protein
VIGNCKGCGTRSSGLWYKDRTQCGKCYQRVRRDIAKGIPAAESVWNIWNSSRDQGKIVSGLCLVCGTTDSEDWSEDGNKCRDCFVKGITLGVCDLCGYDLQVRSTFSGRGQLCSDCWESNFKGYQNGRYYPKKLGICAKCNRELFSRFVKETCEHCRGNNG